MRWISVASDVEVASRGLDDFGQRQVPFATALALTWTAQDAQSGVQDSLARRFTLRNNWVRSGIRITAAKKGDPVAVVGSIETFMGKQETGGSKTARSHSRVAIPVEAKRNKRDIIPKGQRPGALKGKPRILARNGSNLIPIGSGFAILQRAGKDRYPLKALYRFKGSVQIKPRFGFKGTVSDIVARRFASNMVRALDQAKASAR